VNLYNVLLNNKIPFTLLETTDSENVIYCKSFSDYLFNVGTFVTKTKEVILEYVTEGEEKYVIADVTFNDGTCFTGVRFKVIVNEHVETPHSTINLNQLQGGIQVQLPQTQPEIIEEETVEPPPSPVLELVSVPDYTEHVQQALHLEKHLQREKQAIEKQKILLEKQNLINKKLSEYKQELLEEYVNVADKQKNLLTSHINDSLTVAEQDLNLRITNTFNEYEVQLEEHKHKTKSEQLEFIIQKINESIESVQTELNDLVTGKFSAEQDHLQQLLQDKSQSLQEKYEQKLILELEKYKETLFEEFYLVSSDAIQRTLEQKKDLTEQQIIEAFNNREKTFNTLFESKLKGTTDELNSIVQQFSNKLPGIDDNIKLLEDKINSLIEEKKKLDDSGKFNTTQQKYIADTAQYWARRILDLGGGGGSVAVQYAKGGTMDGNLSVNNLYPNNNNGEIGSPSNRWDRIYANQIDSLSSNIVVELSGFYVDGDFTVNGLISAVGGTSTNWNSVYTTTNANSSNWNSTYTSVSQTSANWNSVYTNLNSNSANYILDGGNSKGATIMIGTNDNFNLHLETGGTVRMAISSTGQVGIGTFNPAERLTVSGNISSNATVFASVLSADAIGLRNQVIITSISGVALGPNVFIGGFSTGNINSTGNHNFVFGLSAGNRLTTGINNTIFGNCAGPRLTTGGSNIAIGFLAGYRQTTGSSNVFFGNRVGTCITTSSNNNFIGNCAGYGNTGSNNNFFGYRAGRAVGSGSNNNFFGNRAGYGNSTGSCNVFIGTYAGCCNGAASFNTFIGFRAGLNNNASTAACNVFIGQYAGCTNTSGGNNVAIGTRATAIGILSASVSNSIMIGLSANATGSNQLVFGNPNIPPLSGIIFGQLATTARTNALSTIDGTSDQWNSNFTTTRTNSAAWSNWSTVSGNYATVSFTDSKYLPLSGGTIDGNLTINGSITALGNATFQNTIFTTTSALSVINFGAGPALYVSQSPGNFDVASFYDQDGIEVLHVGNAPAPGMLAKVGINESFPSAELTVHGSISASGSIVAQGYNNNNWDSNYTTTNNNSAGWSNWSTVSASYALGSQYVKLSGDTMTGTLNVPSLSVSDTFTVANNTFFASVSGNVGIGTSNPLYKFHVVGAAGNLFSIIDSLTGQLFSVNKIGGIPIIEVFDTDTVKMGTYLSNTLLVSGTQVSMGGLPVTVGSFPHKLTVYGRSTFTDTLSTRLGTSDNWSSTYTSVSQTSANWNSAYTNLSSNSANYILDGGNSKGATIMVGTNDNFDLHLETGGTVRMAILSTGQVGIGTFNPTERLTVSGNISGSGNITMGGIGTFNHVQANTKSFYIDHPTQTGRKLQYGSLESPYHGVRLTGENVVVKGECTVKLPDYTHALVREEGINIQITNIEHSKTIYVDSVDIKNNEFTVKINTGLFDSKKYKFFWSFSAIRKDIPELVVEV